MERRREENHGTEYKTRWRLLRERVLAMKEIWTKDEAEFHGELVNFDKLWSYPKPEQKPHPPILMGGDGATTLIGLLSFAMDGCRLMFRLRNAAEKIAAYTSERRRRPRSEDHLDNDLRS